MKIDLIACLLLLTLFACTSNHKRYHDGMYVYSDSLHPGQQVQKIKVEGGWIYHIIQPSDGKSKTKAYTFPCIQYPDKISLPLPKGHSVTIDIDQEGNLIYDQMTFKKEWIHIIDPTPVPKAFIEAFEKK